ncbi:TadG family pilus assembly protein [Burkholderia sp. Bp8963]|uniref:TadG family pilus assembly protein n=1 Tax=Burkholderia sp. Bp8963 TaxID=2184547 RepID=UPI0021AB2AA9|nr:TadG family pilus assembly protein [Burkholderia sp. Bp8963]
MRSARSTGSCARPRDRRRMGGQRGAVAVLAAVWVLLAVVVLGAIDIGNLFFQRRDLQRIADMSALAAAQRMDDKCAQPTTTATQNASANGFDPQASGNSMSIVCGRWDVAAFPNPPYFGSASSQLNAVQVTLSKPVPFFFLGPKRTVTATSIGKEVNPDSFTLGTSLVTLQGGLVNNVLGALLGANLNLSAVSYQGLATTQIALKDLVVAANVGTVDQLANVSVTAGGFAQLLVTALSKTQVANVNAGVATSALQAIAKVAVGTTTVNVLSNGSTPGVLAVGLANKQAAADARVTLLDALMVAAEVAAAGQPAVNVNTGVNLGLVNATLQVQIIKPPVLAVGEGGIDPTTGTWRTQASTAQVRLYLNADLGTTNITILNLLGLGWLNTFLNKIVSADVHLPIYLEVAPGTAWLVSTNCAPTQAASRAVVGVQTGVANLCIGDTPPNMSAQQPFSCTVPATILSASVLGTTAVQVKANLALPASVPSSSSATLTFNGVAGDSDDYQTTNANAVGSVLTNALSGVANSLASTNGLALYIGGASVQLGTMLDPLISVLTGALAPLLSALDQIIVPLLNLLGAQVGVSTVHNQALTCGVAQTVSN